jgi:hypothetical protein
LMLRLSGLFLIDCRSLAFEAELAHLPRSLIVAIWQVLVETPALPWVSLRSVSVK